MLPSASSQLRLEDNFCCPCALIYNPVSCKNYRLKSLLNELLVRSRDYTSSWKHKVYYSSTFSFYHQWLSHDNSIWLHSFHSHAGQALQLQMCSAMQGHQRQTHHPTSQMLNRLKKVLIFERGGGFRLACFYFLNLIKRLNKASVASWCETNFFYYHMGTRTAEDLCPSNTQQVTSPSENLCLLFQPIVADKQERKNHPGKARS